MSISAGDDYGELHAFTVHWPRGIRRTTQKAVMSDTTYNVVDVHSFGVYSYTYIYQIYENSFFFSFMNFDCRTVYTSAWRTVMTRTRVLV